MDAFGIWLKAQLARVSGKSRLGEKLRYIHSHWGGLQVFLTDGRVKIDSNMILLRALHVSLGLAQLSCHVLQGMRHA